MKTKQLQGWIRLILIVCGIAMVAVLFFPMWRIELNAPQYPEGLNLLIYPHKLGGNVDIINGLNHYIGMHTLHTEDFIEFKILPYCIIFFAIAFVAAGIVGSRKLLHTVFILFVLFGIVAMVDFWRWEYNYGHNLDPNAAIIVPGMAYQPPLIGYKQLLNFGAFSIPDIGGWIFVSVGIVLLVCVVAVWRLQKKTTHAKRHLTAVAGILPIILFSSCKADPEPIRAGIDHCYYCKMTIADQRFGAEVVTNKGKVYKFDDAHCILSFLKTKEVTKDNIKAIYFADFGDEHRLRKVDDMCLCKTDAIKSPMGANIIAFGNKQALLQTMEKLKCESVSWETLSNQ